MNDLVIYSSLLSANGRKVQSVCVQLGIEAKLINTNVYAGDGQLQAYLKINPLGKIPALTDANIVLTESNAIIIYLSEKYGNESLHGSSVEERAEINKWLFWESSQWQPLLINTMERHVGSKLFPSIVPAPTEAAGWEDEVIRLQLHYLERSLLGKEYLVSDRLTLADFSVAAMTTYFTVANFPYEQYENMLRWRSTLSNTEAWKLTEHKMWQKE